MNHGSEQRYLITPDCIYSKVDFRPVFAPTDPQISHFSRETLLRRITVFGVRSYPPVYFGPEYPPGNRQIELYKKWAAEG